MNSKFYKILQKKLLLPKNRKQEELFLESFQNEFGDKKKGFSLWKLFPVFSTAICLIFIFSQTFTIDRSQNDLSLILEEHEMLMNFEVIAELDDMNLSDEEWDILLKESLI